MNKLIFVFFIAIWTSAFGQPMPRTAESPADFVPSGYVVFDKVLGDLNKDDQEDYVLIIKEAKKSNVVKNRFGDEVDTNRRGIIIAFKKGNKYELVLENRDCFSSENEDRDGSVK